MDGLRNVTTMNSLSLFENQLQNLNGLKSMANTDILYLHSNPDLHIEFLPASLQSLDANVAQLLNLDFKSLPKLKKLQSGSRNRKAFRNLSESVEMV